MDEKITIKTLRAVKDKHRSKLATLCKKNEDDESDDDAIDYDDDDDSAD